MNTNFTRGEAVALRQGIEVQSDNGDARLNPAPGHEVHVYPGGNAPGGIHVCEVLVACEFSEDGTDKVYHLTEAEGLANLNLIAAAFNAASRAGDDGIAVVAAAAETAIERDRLLAVNMELVEALEFLDDWFKSNFSADGIMPDTAHNHVKSAIAHAKEQL